MSLNTTTDPQTDSLSEVTPVISVHAADARPMDGWLRGHIKAIASLPPVSRSELPPP